MAGSQVDQEVPPTSTQGRGFQRHLALSLAAAPEGTPCSRSSRSVPAELAVSLGILQPKNSPRFLSVYLGWRRDVGSTKPAAPRGDKRQLLTHTLK